MGDRICIRDSRISVHDEESEMGDSPVFQAESRMPHDRLHENPVTRVLIP